MKIWDLYAPIYERAMKSDQKSYDFMYRRIAKVIKDKKVLEIATGPGMIAKHVAHTAASMIATDYSEGMIREAKKGSYPDNLSFEIADAMDLPYEDKSFDVVIIANALHIVPDPEMVLKEILRVITDRGILIAPNFVEHDTGMIGRIWSAVLKAAGIRFEHQWSADTYKDFLRENGWRIVNAKELGSRITMVYTECIRQP